MYNYWKNRVFMGRHKKKRGTAIYDIQEAGYNPK